MYRSIYRLLECAVPSGEVFVIRRESGAWSSLTASGRPLSGLSEIIERASGSQSMIRLDGTPSDVGAAGVAGPTVAVRQKDDPTELVGVVSARPGSFGEAFDALPGAAPFIAWLVETAQPSGTLPRSRSGRRLAPVADRGPRGLHQGEWMALPSLEVAACVKPSRRVGGDFFDVVGLGTDEAVVGLGDVSGKGPQAALLATLARSAFHVAVREQDDPAGILQAMNELLTPLLERVQAFVTFVAARLGGDPPTLAYASAGHVEPVLWLTRGEQLELLPATGLPLGVDPSATHGSVRIDLAPASLVVLYSDGVTEAEDEDGKVLGLQGLADMIHASHPATAAEQVSMIMAGLDVHRGSVPLKDDVAILLVRTEPEAGVEQHVVPFVIPAETGALRLLVDLTRRELRSTDLIPESQRADLADAMATAVAEIAANQIEHAYHGFAGRIQGRLTIRRERLEADLYDSGSKYAFVEVAEFDRRDPPLRGYGLKMVRSLVDECVYRRLDGTRNHWHLVRYLDRGGGDGDRHQQI